MTDDGVIKFQYDWKKENITQKEKLEELIKYRDLAHKMKYIGVYSDGIGYGNISKRVENGFIISGSATGSITQSNLNHFSLVHKWSVANNKIWCKGPIPASSESLSHSVIYNTLPKARVILHIHHLKMWEKYYHSLPSTCSNIPYGTPDMAMAIKFLIKNHNDEEGIFLMKGHKEGLVAFGKNFESIFQIFKDLE